MSEIMQIDIYSERNVLLGSKYYEIQNLSKDQEQPIEIHFKAQYAKYYDVSIVDSKEEKKLELEFIPEDLSKGEILLGTLIILILL